MHITVGERHIMLKLTTTRCAVAAARVLLVRSTQCHQSRRFSAVLPDGWEMITRRNGAIVYYNAALRKTVRELPGFPRQHTGSSNDSAATAPPPKATPTAQHAHDDPQPVAHDEHPENQVFVPIDFAKAMKIEGHESQVIRVDLEPQQCLRAETGAMIYMTDGVEMETTSAGGFQQGVKRMMTGENFFVSRFTYQGTTKGSVALGTSFPSKIVHLRLADFLGNSIICQKGAFLCGSDTINIEMEFAKKFGVGFFGGEGFILQRLTGSGDAFVRASGALIERELAPDEVLRISSGCLVAFEPSVHYDITMMKGVKNVVFGGEGLFVTTLTGPGKIYLQSLPFDRLVGEIASRVPAGRSGGMMLPFFGGGGGSSGNGEGSDGAPADGTESITSEDGASFPTEEESSWNTASPSGQDDANIYGGAQPSTGSQFDDTTGMEVDAELPGTEEAAGTFMGFFGQFFKSD